MYPMFGYKITSNTRVNNSSTSSVFSAIRLIPTAILRKTGIWMDDRALARGTYSDAARYPPPMEKMWSPPRM
jgi:hypothetical protein